MTSRNPFVDDFAKVASSAFETLSGLREEAQSAVRSQMENLLSDMDFVSRDEFDAVRAMALKARDENDALAEQIAELKAQIAAAAKPAPKAASSRAAAAPAAKKPAAKKPAAKKAAPKTTARKTTTRKTAARKTAPKAD